jgi:hypothetical protein
MRTLVLFESMYGHTRRIAEAIGDGLRPAGEARVVPIGEVSDELVAWAELVVVGGPTHARGMSSEASRANAVETAAKPDGWSEMALEPDATGPGIREWLEGAVGDGKPAATFDTRIKAPAFLTGRASGEIAKGLRGRGFTVVADPESFLLDSHSRLVAGEIERARAWGTALVGGLVPSRLPVA